MDSLVMPAGLEASSLRSLTASKLAVDAQASPKETAQKFEALLATMLVKEMRRAVPEGFFGDGAAGDIYSGWLDEHVGAAVARDDGLHVREMLERSVMQKVEASR